MRRIVVLSMLAQLLAASAVWPQARPLSNAPRQLPPGLYLGSWDDEYRAHWLALFVDPAGNAVTYDPPNLLSLCSLSVRADSVSLRTGQMTEWSSGLAFTLSIEGVLKPAGISGTAQQAGRNISRGPVPIRMTRYTVDTTTSRSDSALLGFYSALRYIPENGDVLGDELLLARTTTALVALWTEYAGAPDGPYAADTVTIHGNRVRIVLNAHGLYTQRPLPPLERTFALRTLGPARRPVAGDSSLVQEMSLKEFLRHSRSAALRRTRCS